MAALYMGQKVLIILEVELVTRSTLKPDNVVICTFNFWMLLANMIVYQLLVFQMDSSFTTWTQFTNKQFQIFWQLNKIICNKLVNINLSNAMTRGDVIS